MNNFRRLTNNFILLAFLLILMLFLFRSQIFVAPDMQDFTLNRFEEEVTQGNVEKVTVKDKDQTILGTLKDGTKFRVSYPQSYEFSDILLKNGVEVQIDPQNQSLWWSLLSSFLPFLIMFGLLFFFLQQMQGSGNKVMSFGKSRAKMFTKDQPRVTFQDVAGVDEAVEELREIEEFLEGPAKFQSLGAKIPKGVLLYGPPGTGKTLLARAVAGEAGVPFFSISGSDFVEMFVGVGASRVRDLFEQAKANAPCIIFVDEIDAVGRHRGAGLGGGHDEREQTLNQLLVEMDGFDVHDTVILIAATNRPDILDPALLRTGRFDRHIAVDRPDLVGREKILEVHARGKPLEKDADLKVIARQTPGFTGADLANLLNEAALLAARHGKKKVSMSELEQAIERVIAGPERKTRVMSQKEKNIVAYHEAGHALIAHYLPHTNPVHKISIVSRGRALGYTITLPTEDKYLVSRSELYDNLAQLLGGRVAEQLIFGDITTGAQNDLETATKIARQMVCEYGMSDTLGPLTLGQKQDQVFLGRDFASHPDYSEQVAFEIDKEIRRIVDEAYNKAEDILEEHRDKMDLLAEELMEKETLSRKEVLQLLSEEGASAEAEPQKGETERQQERPEERVRPRRERKLIRPEPAVE
ncbi:cell division protease FtsH [Candidatus Hakubella thermalkaliphila]|uniref:ATP-dependent zinc metalloprotease FtsH n=3 Tax=Candidatus Hakubella thermalkaliphila TaxID=2754717 RepID=A0A6V8PZQ7_9ACTN|nr:ATP-dependent zinc metalloprotease FtsH [Candidatus Hakubella thermalkaliphila]GFP22555.1 cell division protease FtsH [Candidatus Hakubella thermalkaliphila]GFP36586.1 cell division protease FtsH [Candidatus Hakubella thermalkaliphila]GFP38485.1 cell division protease FtsH [Candidatus Hakubella thermalkaliphila]